jgi:hypothetical protein
MMAELVREARERILVILVELVDVKVRGLTRAGQPNTNESRLVVSEHHPVLHAGTLGLALRATGAAAYAVAVDRESPAKTGAAREALPETPPAWKSFAPAISGKPHRSSAMARLVPARAGPLGAMPNWRLVPSLARMQP